MRRQRLGIRRGDPPPNNNGDERGDDQTNKQHGFKLLAHADQGQGRRGLPYKEVARRDAETVHGLSGLFHVRDHSPTCRGSGEVSSRCAYFAGRRAEEQPEDTPCPSRITGSSIDTALEPLAKAPVRLSDGAYGVAVSPRCSSYVLSRDVHVTIIVRTDLNVPALGNAYDGAFERWGLGEWSPVRHYVPTKQNSLSRRTMEDSNPLFWRRL